MPVSAATIPAPAAAARSSRSATGRRPERGTRNAERGTDGPTSVVLLRVPSSAFRAIRVPGYLPSHLCSPMPLRLAEHPEHDRPRERLWRVGPAALTGQELLALLLGTGCAGRDALVVAGALPGVGDEPLVRRRTLPPGEPGRSPAVRPGRPAP